MRTMWVPDPDTGCWIWSGNRDKDGYGRVSMRGVWNRAHRVMYSNQVGDIPDGLFVCHSCDNPPCVNPEHLFAGTHADNMADCSRKGRRPAFPGESNPSSKLTETDVANVRFMKEDGIMQKDIADHFGVTPGTISLIVLGKTWKG